MKGTQPPRDFAKVLPLLQAWYRANARALPWRKPAPDPYEVWISEVMSQQSTIVTVLPYFGRWMKRFPNLESLAAASEEEVLKLWAGLGYYSRARNVARAARALAGHRQERGRWPESVDEWLKIPGVGPYTASAVSAIAFSKSTLPVDGNVIRVLSRLVGISDPLNVPSERRGLEAQLKLLAAAAKPGSHGELAQAFMELGSQVCRPGHLAQCPSCPVESHCTARAERRVAQLPKKKLRRASEQVRLLGLIYRKPRVPEALLVRRIPEGERLAGQWEIPQAPLEADIADISRTFPVFGPVRHSITHHRYEVFGVEAGPWTEGLPDGHLFWDPERDELDGPLTTLSGKLLRRRRDSF